MDKSASPASPGKTTTFYAGNAILTYCKVLFPYFAQCQQVMRAFGQKTRLCVFILDRLCFFQEEAFFVVLTSASLIR